MRLLMAAVVLAGMLLAAATMSPPRQTQTLTPAPPAAAQGRGGRAPLPFHPVATQPAGAAVFRAQDPRLPAIVSGIQASQIHDDDAHLVAFGTRTAVGETQSTDTRGVAAARKWIAAQFEAISQANGGRLQVAIDTFPIGPANRVPTAQTMANVVATLPGTDPNDKRIFVVGGHYDSIPANFDQDAPGANDDGSGTTVVLACARALSRYQFPATIKFIAFEGEEQGLYGSKHAAETAKANGDDIVAMLNNDIVGGDQSPGRDNTDRVRIYSPGIMAKATAAEIAEIAANGAENDSPAREVARYSAELAGRYLKGFSAVLEYREDRYRRGGDHESFLDQGYPAVRFTDYYENYTRQHQVVRTEDGVEYGDLQKWTSPAYTANVARINALTLASLASAPAAPEHVYLVRNGPDHDATGTTLSWPAVPGATGYHVLLRPTAQPQWTERVAVTGTGVDLEASIDNDVLAVAAVDAQGHESLPVIAVPPPAGRRGGAGRSGGGR